MWINDNDLWQEGEIGYVIRKIHDDQERVTLSRRIGATNISKVDTLRGWLGETNNISAWAEGRAIVTGTNRDGTRIRIRRLADE